MFERIDDVIAAVRGAFGGRPILVVGDLMLDRYLWGNASRISPEAPVPVVRMDGESASPGGAANVAANLAGLGLAVSVCGAVGDDEEGEQLIRLLAGLGVNTDGIVRVPDRPTLVKTRVVGGHQQIVRLDVERVGPLPGDADGNLRTFIRDRVSNACDGVVVSDYGKGVVDRDLCRDVVETARRRGLGVFVDPKGREWEKYSGATALSPNTAELSEATGLPAEPMDGLLRAGGELLERLDLGMLVVTREARGITVIQRGERLDFPAAAREVFDVAGAGDTVLAVLAAGSIAGLGIGDVVRLANLAAGVVVGKVGTVAINTSELAAAVDLGTRLRHDHKICDRQTARELAAAWRAEGKSVVFTNGCFDLLHAGHVASLDLAAREGDRLVVAINSDRSVRALKGEGRPVISEGDRARILAALSAVDLVVTFDEETPLELITQLRPDVIAKGADYTEQEVVGAQEVAGWGGRVALIPLLDGRSTSRIVEVLRRTHRTDS